MSTTFADGVTTAASGTGYPVAVSIQPQSHYSRFFAIPVLGYAVRFVLLIPHLIVLSVVALITVLMHLVAWIPVLTAGTYPQWAYTFSAGTVRLWTRVGAYYYGLTDKYPPFGLGSNDDGYPVHVSIQYPSDPGRLYAIPVVGLLIREVLLIPHLLVLYVLGIIVSLFQYVMWIPVLFGGQYPEVGRSVVGGYLSWSARVIAYIFGLTDRYPPFSFSS